MKVKVYVSTGYVGSKKEDVVEIDDEEWTDMSENERNDYFLEVMFEMINWGWEPLDN